MKNRQPVTEADYHALPPYAQGFVAKLAQSRALGLPMNSPYLVRRHPTAEELSAVSEMDLPRNVRREAAKRLAKEARN
jgi:hypothetical protein